MTLRSAVLGSCFVVAATGAACSGPKGSTGTVGPRAGESTAPLPSDPSTPNPDAGDVPPVPTESPVPGAPQTSAHRAQASRVAQVPATGTGKATRPPTAR